jgi:hypothetical protein
VTLAEHTMRSSSSVLPQWGNHHTNVICQALVHSDLCVCAAVCTCVQVQKLTCLGACLSC